MANSETITTPIRKTKLQTMVASNCSASLRNLQEKCVNQQHFRNIDNLCGKSFNMALDVQEHTEIHARGSEYRCMICGNVCLDENALAAHVQSTHKNLPQHTCALCGRRYKDSKALLKHSWEHSREKSFSCTKCSKTFHNRVQIKRHMISHRDKTVACDICEEDFPDGRSLLNHRHCHSNAPGQRFPCNVCGKTFGTRSSQQIHIRIHTGERPYGCRFCWKAFADGGTLRKHERIHTGERPYACAVCPKAFNQRVVLREHIRSHHSDPDPKYFHSTTPYCCAVCSDMFAISEDLILHLIHHCDINTAMNRQPQVGPRRYKRRRMLKPFELALANRQPHPKKIIILNNRKIIDIKKDYANPEVEEVYSEAADGTSKTNENEMEQSGDKNAPTRSVPKMIYTSKTGVTVETSGDEQIKDGTVDTRTQATKTFTENNVELFGQLEIIQNNGVHTRQPNTEYVKEAIFDGNHNTKNKEQEIIEDFFHD